MLVTHGHGPARIICDDLHTYDLYILFCVHIALLLAIALKPRESDGSAREVPLAPQHNVILPLLLKHVASAIMN